jgi:hypothetical protein
MLAFRIAFYNNLSKFCLVDCTELSCFWKQQQIKRNLSAGEKYASGTRIKEKERKH